MEEERKLSRGKRKEYDDISATLPINSLRGVELGGASVSFRVAKQTGIGCLSFSQNDSPTVFGIGSLQFHSINLSGQGLPIYS
jgi:hypothetical protein